MNQGTPQERLIEECFCAPNLVVGKMLDLRSTYAKNNVEESRIKRKLNSLTDRLILMREQGKKGRKDTCRYTSRLWEEEYPCVMFEGERDEDKSILN